MERSRIFEVLQEIVREELDEPELLLQESSAVGDHPNWDSLAHFRIIVALEARFGIALDLDEHAEMVLVGDIIDPIVRRIAARDPAEMSPADFDGRLDWRPGSPDPRSG